MLYRSHCPSQPFNLRISKHWKVSQVQLGSRRWQSCRRRRKITPCRDGHGIEIDRFRVQPLPVKVRVRNQYVRGHDKSAGLLADDLSLLCWQMLEKAVLQGQRESTSCNARIYLRRSSDQ